MTKQEIFDAVVRHAYAQREHSRDEPAFLESWCELYGDLTQLTDDQVAALEPGVIEFCRPDETA